MDYARDLSVRIVEADIRDRQRIRETIAGHDLVFHLAAWFELGVAPRHEAEMRAINAEGTRNVLEEAWSSGAQRIVYCSTVGALGSSGPAGRLGNELQKHDGRFQSLYVKTKHEGYLVAKELMARGAPIITVMPSPAYGPGDTGIVARQLLLSLQGKMTAIPGSPGTYCYIHVDDIANGLWLAAEKGRIGEAYILAGSPTDLADFYQKAASYAHVAPPKRKIPPRLLRSIAWLLETVPGGAAAAGGRPLTREAVAMITRANWAFSAAKAHSELGWKARSLDDGLGETIQWVRDHPEIVVTGSRGSISSPVSRAAA
jgi:dihydroflavonol-4-reductase